MSPFEVLKQIHAIDLEFLGLRRRLQAGPEELLKREKEVEAVRASRRAVEGMIQEQALAADRCSLDVRSLESEMRSSEEKIRGIKNNKEYKILTDRIRDLKQSISDRETEGIKAMEEIDRQREAMKERQAAVAAAEAGLEALRKEIEAEAASIRRQGQELKNRRQAIWDGAKSEHEAALEAYESAFKRCKGDALALLENGICQSCHERQSPNTETMVQLGRDIKKCRCASCGRILFIRPA